MKCSFVFLALHLTFAGMLLAGGVSSQDLNKVRIDINLEGASIQESLLILQQKSGIQISFFDSQLAKETKKVTLHSKDIPAGDALRKILKGTDLVYRIMKDYVIIDKRAPVAKPGTVSGLIMDGETGEALIGATVTVKNSAVNSLADMDGRYTLRLEPGAYELEFRFLGYQAKIVQAVIIQDNTLTTLNVSMLPDVSLLGEVVVTAEAEKASVEALYTRQKNAAGITDGISADQISRTPDKNIAETLKRISGLSSLDNKYVVVRGLSERYNQAMMNGQMMPSTELNRKNFSYDIVPTSLVDNVIVIKTLTPDQSAEFGGGLVQINTKDIPSENSLSVTLGSSYNDKTTGKDFRSPEIERGEYFGGISGGRKLFGTLDWKSRENILNSGNFTDADIDRPNTDRALRDPSLLPNNWRLYNYTPLPSFNGQLSVGRVIPLKEEQTLGVIASVSYRNTWQIQDVRMGRDGYTPADILEEKFAFTGKRYGFVTNVGGLTGIGYRNKNHKVSLQSLYLRTLDRQFVLGTGAHEQAGESVGYYDLYTATDLWQSHIKSEHAISKKGMRLNLALSYTQLDRQKPDNHQANLSIFDGAEDDNPNNPHADFSITQAFSSQGDGALRWWSRALEKNLAWNIDLSLPFKFDIVSLPVTNVLKTGYSGWRKDRLFFVMLTESKFFLQGEPEPLGEAFDPTGGGAIYSPPFGDDFHRKPVLQAGYIMLDNKIGKKLRLVWGVRAEHYNLNGVNALLESFEEAQTTNNNNLDDYSDLHNREPNLNIFPSANLTYSLTPTMNFRLAYSKSIIRPDIREISFFREYDFELGGNYWSQSPIISTKIHHYDFRYEWYPSAGEMVSLSFFYKKLHYPMEIFAQPNRLFELRNDKDAINKGIEVELRKSFAFTGVPVLKNITLSGNFTRLFSNVRTMTVNYRGQDANNPHKLFVVETVGPEEDRPQAGASNYMYNAGIYYDVKALSLSLSYNYIANRFYRVGSADVGSLYEQPMQPLDAQVALKILKSGMIKLNVSNLLNSKYILYSNRYAGTGGYSMYPENGRQPTAKELLYQKGLDTIDYEAAPGRTWSLSFSYNF